MSVSYPAVYMYTKLNNESSELTKEQFKDHVGIRYLTRPKKKVASTTYIYVS